MIKSAIKILFVICFLGLGSALVANDSVLPVANYSFNTGIVSDETGNSLLYLRNNCALFQDSERGSVLRFLATDKSYAVFNKQLLNTDSSTIAFFFYWESAGARTWHQLFEISNLQSKSNLFFTPLNGWGNNLSTLIVDSKEYSSYAATYGSQISQNKWTHVAVTFADNLASVYIDGALISKNFLVVTPKALNADSLLLGGNPYRSDNYYISARFDEIRIYNKALAANQVEALANEQEIPLPNSPTTNWSPTGALLNLTLDLNNKKQTIQNFGSSDGWNTERIGKYWPLEKKEKLAELLFSSEKDAAGNPKGIGLSSWRFNIGAGTAEQGDASRISSEWRRTEGFLNNDGSYNWNKQEGQQWFFKRAVDQYNIHHLIGWQNSPPVQYTKNNLGFRDYGTPKSTILKTEYFDDFAKFLGDVALHFKTEGYHFDFISPLNEPQWDWSPSSFGGTVTQEGTPWTNEDIYNVAIAIDKEFVSRSIDTKIFFGEAGSINHLISGTGPASNQLLKFWNSFSSLSLVSTPSVANIASYHSYFTDFGSNLVTKRKETFDRTKTLNPSPELWQTEYSLLQNGYRDGYPTDYKLTEMECAISLTKVIMCDLNIANVTAWQWWSTFESGKHNGESRFNLIEALTNNDNTDGIYHANKLFYSLGNFSHFIRPGMKRIEAERSDNLSELQQVSDVMFSAYTNAEESKVVLVAANFTKLAREVNLKVINTNGKQLSNPKLYLTNEFSNLEKQSFNLSSGRVVVPAQSVLTYTADLSLSNGLSKAETQKGFVVKLLEPKQTMIAVFEPESKVYSLNLFDMHGRILKTINRIEGQNELEFSISGLTSGIYFVRGVDGMTGVTKKIIIKD